MWLHLCLTEELLNVYFSPDVIKVNKLRRAGDVARMWERRISCRFLVGKQE
jgi:hypothetical protein